MECMTVNIEITKVSLEVLLFCLMIYRIFIKKQNIAMNGFVLGVMTIYLIKSAAKVFSYLINQ